MIKKKKLLFALLSLILVVCMTFTLFACNKDDDNNTDGDDTDTTEYLFTNGDFTGTSSASSDAYPHTPTDWTATPGSTSSSSTLKTPQGTDDIAVGIIDVKSGFDNIGTPGKPEGTTDDKVLMIYNKTYTSYKYVSSNTSIEKDKYYKLTFSVRTNNLAGEANNSNPGAYVSITGDMYADFAPINTNGQWVEYTIYIKGSNSGNTNFQLNLGLGTGNKESGTMVKGEAYFDNVVLEDLTDVEEGETVFTAEQFANIQRTATVEKVDAATMNPYFNYYSSVSNSTTTTKLYTPAQLSGKGGTGSGTSASTGSSYVEKGIIDMADSTSYTLSAISDAAYTVTKASENSVGSKMLMIYNKKSTGYGYKENIGMYIEKAKYYEITIKVRSTVAEGSGAMVRLVNTSSEEIAKVENINTSGDWQTISFFVAANAYSDNTVFAEFWNGFGGEGDGKWTTGVVFFDDLTYEEITEEQYTTGSTASNSAAYSFATTEGTLVDMTSTLFKSTQYEESFLNTDGTLKYTEVSITSDSAVAFNSAENTYMDTLAITNKKPSAFSVSTIYKTANDVKTVDETNKNAFVIAPNTVYELTFWLKTVNVDTASSATVDIISYNPEKSEDYDSATSSIVSISSVNTDNLSTYVDENHSNYVRYTVYILGAEKDTTYAGISATLGTGSNAAQSSSFVLGSLYISNIRMQTIDYSTYTSASTSSVVYKKSLGGSGSSSELSSNGTFSYIDLSTTNSTYKDSPVFTDNKLTGTAVPSNWTCTNSAALTVNGGSSKAGVIDVNNYDLTTIDPALTAANIYDSLSATMTAEKYPNVLYINSVNEKSLGYKANSISLSAKSYYMISVYAKAITGTFSIDVTPTTLVDADSTAAVYSASDVGSDWNQYLFFIKTGVTSTTLQVSLYAGFPGNTAAAGESKVLFTLANYSSIDETVYNQAKETYDSIENHSDYTNLANRSTFQSWYTDTMDTTSTSYTDKLNTPSNWTGSTVDSAASTSEDDLVKGLFNRTSSDWNLLNIDPDAADSFANNIYANADATGDSVLVINNKEFGSYGYTSSSFVLDTDTSATKYYKITIDILTKDIKYIAEADVDTSLDTYKEWTNKNLLPTATITLSINNKTYTFGKQISDTADEAAAKNRQVTNTEWKTYTYYVALDSEITDTVKADLKIALGGKNVSYWESGYVFADNFAVESLTEEEFTAQAPTAAAVTYGEEGYNKETAATTYRIDFNQADAEAEVETEDDDDDSDSDSSNEKDWLWLYITSGVIGGVIVVVLVIFIIKKYAKKGGKKIKKAKKTTISKDSTRDQFSK